MTFIPVQCLTRVSHHHINQNLWWPFSSLRGRSLYISFYAESSWVSYAKRLINFMAYIYTEKIVTGFTLPKLSWTLHQQCCTMFTAPCAEKCHAFPNRKHEESFLEQTRRKGMTDYASRPIRYTIPSSCITFNKAETYDADTQLLQNEVCLLHCE